MNHAEAESVAQDWIASWNGRDLERVLAKFSDGVIFASQKAVGIVGTGHIVGKDQLRAYWTAALERLGDLHFKLDHVGFDEKAQELFIVYEATLAGQTSRACERLRFGADGVVEGEAFYGTPV
jgi:ketosteroid isomerase-like protein